MKGKKEIAILIFVIAVLAFYLSSQKDEKTHYKLPDVKEIQTDTISQIKIKKKESEIVLRKESDKWIIGDKKYPADNAMVENMLKAISGLRLTVLASESKNYSIYKLDEKNRVEVEAYKGDTLLRKIYIGKPASSYRHTFVMIGDDHRVYHAGGNIKVDFDKKISDLRDKTVMAFNDDIMEVVLKKGEEEITIARATAPVSVDVTEEQDEEAMPKWTVSDGREVKESEVETILNALSDFRCDGFIEDKTKEDFKAPIFTVTLKGVDSYTISFFEKKEGRYPAISSESEYPFLVSEWKADKIMKEPDSLKEEKQ